MQTKNKWIDFRMTMSESQQLQTTVQGTDDSIWECISPSWGFVVDFSSSFGSLQLLFKIAADPVVASEESAAHSRNKINDYSGTIPNSKFRIAE